MADSGDSAATIAAAREREKRLRSITRTAPDAIVIIGETGTIDTVNPGGGTPLRLFRRRARRPECEDPHASPHREAHDSHLARYRARRARSASSVLAASWSAGARTGRPSPRVSRSERSSSIRGGLFTGFIHDITERETSSRRAGILQQELMHASRLSAMGEMRRGLRTS